MATGGLLTAGGGARLAARVSAKERVVRAMPLCVLSAVVLVQLIAAAQEPLTEQQVNDAIALGKAGTVPIVRVSKFLGDFDIFIEGPVARIAAAAADATKRYRPFDVSKVTRDLAAPNYTIYVRHSQGSRSSVLASDIVLQPKGAKGMDGVIQPVRERLGVATFDHFPDGDFQVVVVTGAGPQTYTVAEKDCAKIQ